MSPRYCEALSEVEYIINNLNPKELEKIPIKLREFIKENKSRREVIVDLDNLNKETNAILAFIYRKYIASDEEKIILEKEYVSKLKEEKEMLRQNNAQQVEIKYNTEIIHSENDIENKGKMELEEYKEEKWFARILNKIKKLFSK